MRLKKLFSLLSVSAMSMFLLPQHVSAIGVGNLQQSQLGTYYFELSPGEYTITIGAALGDLDGALLSREGELLQLAEERGEDKFQISISAPTSYLIRALMSRCMPGPYTANGCSAYVVVHDSAGDLVEIPILDVDNEQIIQP